MNRLKLVIFCVFLATNIFISNLAISDHPPKKLMRNFNAYAQLGETGQLGPFRVNVAKFGSLPNGATSSEPNEKLSEFLSDKFNLASIVIKQGKIVYEAYNSKLNINSNTPLLGMSMSKTAVSASVGKLICDGKIKSIEDKVGDYSKFLKSTVFADVTIKNVLQMNSGVSPLGRTDEKKFNRKSKGVENFEGQASVRDALQFYKVASRKQGEEMNYHSTDTLALSVLVEDISGIPLSKYFYENLYKSFGKSGYMQWTSDNFGTTVGFSDLVMTARDWAFFGEHLMKQMKENTCLGSFFQDGIINAVHTGKKNGSRYGYQSWVFDVNGNASLVLQGHGGQFIVLDQTNDTLLLTISINENYEAGNLFSNIHKFAERLN